MRNEQIAVLAGYGGHRNVHGSYRGPLHDYLRPEVFLGDGHVDGTIGWAIQKLHDARVDIFAMARDGWAMKVAARKLAVDAQAQAAAAKMLPVGSAARSFQWKHATEEWKQAVADEAKGAELLTAASAYETENSGYRYKIYGYIPDYLLNQLDPSYSTWLRSKEGIPAPGQGAFSDMTVPPRFPENTQGLRGLGALPVVIAAIVVGGVLVEEIIRHTAHLFEARTFADTQRRVIEARAAAIKGGMSPEDARKTYNDPETPDSAKRGSGLPWGWIAVGLGTAAAAVFVVPWFLKRRKQAA